jgi:hypothetical protein
MEFLDLPFEAMAAKHLLSCYAFLADLHLLPFGGDLCRKPTSPS